MVKSINAASRRHRTRIIAAALLYAGTLMLEEHIVRHTGLVPALKFGFALLPALAVVAMIASLGRYLIEERDEYVRARTVRQMLWGTGLSLGALTLWGFPEDAGLLPHMPSYFATIFWFAGFGIAGCFEKLFDR